MWCMRMNMNLNVLYSFKLITGPVKMKNILVGKGEGGFGG